MKVIGAGFGRTGTLSLKTALEELGFNPCYHMVEVFTHPEHIPVWHARGEGKPVDWKKLLDGYQATVDWPGCTFYKELMEVYPDAKVLLSVRDPGKWYESAYNTIYSVNRPAFPMSLMRPFIPIFKRMRGMVDAIVWQGTFSGKFEDRAYAIDVFNRHIEEVKRHVPADRLLVYDVKEGWEPLCRFLGVPVPNKPFPRLNDTEAFQQRIKRRTRVVYGVLSTAAALIALGVYLALR